MTEFKAMFKKWLPHYEILRLTTQSNKKIDCIRCHWKNHQKYACLFVILWVCLLYSVYNILCILKSPTLMLLLLSWLSIIISLLTCLKSTKEATVCSSLCAPDYQPSRVCAASNSKIEFLEQSKLGFVEQKIGLYTTRVRVSFQLCQS